MISTERQGRESHQVHGRHRRSLLLALLSAGVAAALFFLYVQKFERESSGGERVRVLVALRTLERGQTITEDALTVREVPQAYVEDRVVRQADRAKVLGLRVGGLVQAQETLMWTDLAVAGEVRRELSALVQPGTRAATIHLRDETAAVMIQPGDYVDVLTLSQTASGEVHAASVLLQRVLVLAVGNSTRAEDLEKSPLGSRSSELTLSVTLADAQLLAVASERGGLSVVLRSPEDNRTADRVPSVTLASVAEGAPHDDVHTARRGAPAPPREMRPSADFRAELRP
jgi:pilus assembly protein CpaB